LTPPEGKRNIAVKINANSGPGGEWANRSFDTNDNGEATLSRRVKEMKHRPTGILQKLGVSVVTVAALMFVSLGAAPSASAVTKGSATAVLYTMPSTHGMLVTWGGNMTGWARGDLDIKVWFYKNDTQAGYESRSCKNCTSLSVPNTELTLPDGTPVGVKVEGCGPGGCDTHTKGNVP
jgi:hypothetical protein